MPKDGIMSRTITELAADHPSRPDRFIVQWWGGAPNRFYELASVRVDDAPDHHYRSDGGLARKVEIRWAAVKDDPRLDQARAVANALGEAVALAERFEEDPDRYANTFAATLLTGGLYRPLGS